jgi:hypothetical protein
MLAKFGKARRSLKAIALAVLTTTAAFAPAAAQTASGGPVRPSYGNIGPFYGNIGPFYGNIGPFYGNIGPFYGNIGPFYGNIGPFYGNIGPFYGNIGPFYGNIGPFYGNIGPFYGNIGPFYGGIDPSYGNIGPFYGNIGPFYGNIGPFYGNIGPFYGNIGPFWGEVNPFYGNIGPFYGNIGPFYGNIGPFYGNIGPFYGNIGPFWGTNSPYTGISPQYGNIGPFYGNIGPFWEQQGQFFNNIRTTWEGLGAYAGNEAAYAALRDQFAAALANSAQTWGGQIQTATGQSFETAFQAPFLARFGLDLSNPESFANLPAQARSYLFLDWYDALMTYSGWDRPDWWMRAANWTPRLAQVQQTGQQTTIGLIDLPLAGVPEFASQIVSRASWDPTLLGTPSIHSSAIASLLVSPHDGYGVMGIAPNAKIAAYNPYNASAQTDWPMIRAGISNVAAQGASVVNLSLGIPDKALDAGWKNVFADATVAALRTKLAYVIAAGNGGQTQTGTIDFNGVNKATAFLVVGSVDMQGQISSFSNRPGEACIRFTGSSTCPESDKLKYKFIVAPGEFLLVSDGYGNTARASGTSFAAPLVTGAIALIHDRWPWLKQYPAETVDVIVKSAKDLGAPGVDGVYGVGALDIAASQAPLNFNNLVFYENVGGAITERKAQEVRRGGVKTTWETSSAYFTVFEKLGRTQRDFVIPLSSRLVGLNVGNTGRQFQDYLYGRLVDWITKGGTSGFTDMPVASVAIPNSAGLNLTVSAAAPNPISLRYSRTGGRLQSAIRLDSGSGKLGFSFGQGEGAIALNSRPAFGLISDYSVETGGVNPILGFASGGAYANVDMNLSDRLSISVGTTQHARNIDTDFTDMRTLEERLPLSGLKAYSAIAAQATVTYRPTDAVTLTGSMTTLDEATGMLGMRSVDPRDLDGGSRTNAVTVGADVALGGGFRLSGSATASQTKTSGRAAALSTDGRGLVGSSFQMALSKDHVLGKNDHIRFSLAQPLTVESGQLAFDSVEVVNRETGEIGIVRQSFDAQSTSRRLVGEAIYGVSLMGGQMKLNAFGRGELGDQRSDIPSYTFGTRLSFSF